MFLVKMLSLLMAVFILTSGKVNAMNIDSLKQRLTWTKTDTSKVWLLRDISYYYQSVNADSAILYSKAGYDLASAIKFPSGQIWNLYQNALAYETKNQLDTALSIYFKALKIAKIQQDRRSEAKLYNSLGVVYYYAGKFPEAITNYSNGFSLSDSIGYGEGKAYALNNLGVIYRLQHRFIKALEIYNKSLEIKKLERDTIGIINSLYNIGIAYSFLDQYEECLYNLREANRLAELNQTNGYEIANIHIGIGVALYNLGDLKNAKINLEKGLASTENRSGYKWIPGIAYLGAIEVTEGLREEGMKKIEEAYQLALNSGRLELLKGILKERANAAAKIGNYWLSMESWKSYNFISDSLNTQSSRWAQEEMLVLYEMKEKEVTIAQQALQLERETSRKNWYLISGGFLVLMLLSSSVFMSVIWIQREKLKKEVRMKETALKENELLFQEMHHRTKNNLQLLNSLLSLRSRGSDNPEIKEALQSSSESVGALGLLHNRLYKSKDFRKVAFSAYVNDLFKYFNDAFALKERNIILNCECDDIEMDIDMAIPLGLIMNELITNAIKHAFTDEDGGTIKVNFRRTEDKFTLEVIDSGKGLDLNNSHKNGMGRTLIRIFGNKFKAEFKYLTIESGTFASFVIPIQ